MNGTIRGRSPEPGNLIPEAVAALQHLEALGHREPVLLAYHPIARVNPYQALLYGHAWRHGVAPLPIFDLGELDDLAALAASTGARLVLHLHWTNRVLHNAPSELAARAAMTAFLARLDRFIGRGGSLVWTVHNVLPHDAERPELEAELQQAIVDRATIVHVLSANTRTVVAPHFTIPEAKIVHVPHQSYAGAYLDSVTREQARWELGIRPDEVVYAHLGAIKPYKGSDRLLDAFDVLCERDPGGRRLVVAGPPDKAGAAEGFLDRCEIHPFVLLHAGTIPADDMQLFLRASDLVVLPYLRSLNSGVLILALTFGIPVVAPATGGIAEILTPQIGRTFDPEVDDSLLAALIDAEALCTPEAREAALRTAHQYDPERLSADFARAVAERIGGAPPEGVPAGSVAAPEAVLEAVDPVLPFSRP
jgi:glycosyltransferase involved in cell wall biosynthesis